MMKPEEKAAIEAAVAGALKDAEFASLTIEVGFRTRVENGIKEALENGSKEVKVTAIGCLGAERDDISYLRHGVLSSFSAFSVATNCPMPTSYHCATGALRERRPLIPAKRSLHDSAKSCSGGHDGL
jgi:hypothetical protein